MSRASIFTSQKLKEGLDMHLGFTVMDSFNQMQIQDRETGRRFNPVAM